MNNLFENIDPIIFMLSFSIGMFIMMISDPTPRIVIKYPTPYNLNNIYKDSSGTCFRYKMKDTKCTANAKDIQLNGESVKISGL